MFSIPQRIGKNEMAAKTTKQYAAEGITISKRGRAGVFGDVTQYVRGRKQWVKITRQKWDGKWFIARGYEGVFAAHDSKAYSMKAYRWTWDDAIEHAVRLIETWK
jgi:hypothetical protein